jgi:dGTPase
MLEDIVSRIKIRDDSLSPFASKSLETMPRDIPEEPPSLRNEFQRDRDRLIHSNAFRRLKHKTQVFIAPTGDHYVTRLTHTLEVSQIGRTIARALNLNEDLVEAMTLGHDIGHTPFGHLGEDELNSLHSNGFSHATQSVRIVEHLEKNGAGLNLTPEVRNGMVSHSKPKDDISGFLYEPKTLEAQVCRISDAIAYLNHDIGDAIRASVLYEEHIPYQCRMILGTKHSQRIDTMVTDIVKSSWATTGLTKNEDETFGIKMSDEVLSAANTLRDFMFENVYLPAGNGDLGCTAREIIRVLYTYFCNHPSDIPSEYHIRNESPDIMSLDYVSGMTDHFAIRKAEEISPGITKGFLGNRKTL